MAFRLVPREDSFFDLFEKVSANLLQSARLLVDSLERFERMVEDARRMKQLEHEGDQLTHEIMARLHRTFITPLDREDIHQLATALDDVLDFIEEATARFVIYRVKSVQPPAKALASVIVKQVEEIHKLLPELRHVRQDILRHCIEINRLENEGDQLLRDGVAELFNNQVDSLDVMKWREIYELLERATDEAENVAVIIEGIVLKNA